MATSTPNTVPSRRASLAVRGLLAAFALWSVSCSEVGDLPPCETNDDCPEIELCLAGACVPDDPCGAGIYRVEDEPPPYLTPVERISEAGREVIVRSRTPLQGNVAEAQPRGNDQLLVITPGDQEQLFEIDFFVPDSRDETRTNAVFVEFRMRTQGPGGPCQAVVEMQFPSLDPDAGPRAMAQARFCIGEGAFGPGGGRSDVAIEGLDPSQFHTYRIEYNRPVADLDAGSAGGNAPRFDIYIDGVRQGVSYLAEDLQGLSLAEDTVAPRDVFVRFGGARGISVWDFVRWGCVSQSGVCLPKMSENDNRPGTVEDDFEPNDINQRDALGVCSERRLARGENDCGESGRSRGHEECDGFDNDCDGVTDEDFGAEGTVTLRFYPFPEVAADPDPDENVDPAQRVGTDLYLGQECDIGVCTNAVVSCNPAWFANPVESVGKLYCNTDFTPQGTPPALPSDEVCDELDNDCDGYVDENFRVFPGDVLPYPDGETRPLDPRRSPTRVNGNEIFKDGICNRDSVGLCGAVTAKCDGAGALTCDFVEVGRTEICGNRLDDDCDARVDEVTDGLSNDQDNDGAPACQHCVYALRLRDGFPGIFDRGYPNDGWEEALDPSAIALLDRIQSTLPQGWSIAGYIGAGAPTDPDLFDLRDCFQNPEGGLQIEEPATTYDCNDGDPDTAYGKPEICDGADNDCDDGVDEADGYIDAVGNPVEPSAQGARPFNQSCRTQAITNETNTEPVCDARAEACSTTCLEGFDKQSDEETACEPLQLEALETCDDGEPNTRPVRDPRTGRYERNDAGQLVDANGQRLRCLEVCNGLDDDGDGRTDATQPEALVTGPCYDNGLDSDEIDFSRREEERTHCRPGREICVGGTTEGNGCAGQRLPIEEVCDQIDNDCNGSVDEGFLGEDDPVDGISPDDLRDCTDENELVGPCRQAYYRCLPGGADAVLDFEVPQGFRVVSHPTNGTVCVPETKPGELAEICDGTGPDGTALQTSNNPDIDNDCDGRVDEGFYFRPEDIENRRYRSSDHCGRCGNNCDDFADERYYVKACVEIDDENYACSRTCVPGRVDADRDGESCECALQEPGEAGSATRFCDDGEPNEECELECDNSAPAGMCACGEIGQVVGPDNPQPRCGERCNGADDDCDGRPDERRSLLTPECYTHVEAPGAPSTIGEGLCQRGRQACVDGGLAEFVDGTGEPDLQNGDYVDEDMDGCIDEITPVDEICDGHDNDCDGSVDEDFLNKDGDGIGDVARAADVETFDCMVPDRRGDCELGQRRCFPPVAGAAPEISCEALHDRQDEICGTEPGRRNATGDEDCDGATDEEVGESEGPGADSDCSGKNNVRAARCEAGECQVEDDGCELDYYDEDRDGDNGCEADCVGLQQPGRQLGDLCPIEMYPDTDGAQCQCQGVLGCRRFGDGRRAIECRVTLLTPNGEPPSPGDRSTIIYAFDPPLDEGRDPRDRCVNRLGTVAETCDYLDNDCDGKTDETATNDGRYSGKPSDGAEPGGPLFNCGSCGTTCDPPHGVPRCQETGDDARDYVCQISSCDDTFANCDGDLATGCESDLGTDFDHCGTCATSCARPTNDEGEPLNEELDRDGVDGYDGNDGRNDSDPGYARIATGCVPAQTDAPGECRCGEGAACDPGGMEPFCVGEGLDAACVECRASNDDPVDHTNSDCLDDSDAGQYCIAGRCHACNPTGNRGCSLDNDEGENAPETQVCRMGEDNRFLCQRCRNDDDCATAYDGNGVEGSILPYCHNPSDEPEDYHTGGFRGCVRCRIKAGNRPLNNGPDIGCGGERQSFCYPDQGDDGRGQCNGCTAALDCPVIEGRSRTCTNGSCGTCTPAGDDGCFNPTPVCDTGNFSCRPCRVADNNGEGECRDPARPPVNGRFRRLCVPENARDPFGTCQQCNNDEDCRNDEIQQALDPETGQPVATAFNDHICCNSRCIEVDIAELGNCRGCGVGCETDTANECDALNRACKCGENPACGGRTPFCDSNLDGGQCVVCLEDDHCDEGTVCVDRDPENPTPAGRVCRECDPQDNPGEAGRDPGRACPAERPYCNPATFTCRRCEGDAECADGDQCLADGTCGGCDSSADCVDHPAGNLCVDARCSPCVNDGSCQGHPDIDLVGNRCVTEGDRDVCRRCTADEDCAGHPEGNRCQGGLCTSCDDDDDNCIGHFAGNVCAGSACGPCDVDAGGSCAGNQEGIYCNADTDPNRCAPCRDADDDDPNRVACAVESDAPVCDEGTGRCVECRGDFECAELTVEGREICDGGSCRRCDPGDNRGCAQDDATGPICRAVPDGGDNTFCDDCDSDAECVGHEDGNLCIDGRCQGCDNDDDACQRDPSHPVGNVCRGGNCGQCERASDCSSHPVGNVCGAESRCISCGGGVGCGGHPNGNQCVLRPDGKGTCEQCNPALDVTGCTVAAATANPICDADDFRCGPCARDDECGAVSDTLGQCVNGSCQACNPAENRVDGNPACVGPEAGFTCQPSEDEPSVFICRACVGNECADGQGNEGACVSRDGVDICVACDPAANTTAGNALCTGRQTCIDDVCANCAPGDNEADGFNADCAAGTCIGGACFECDVSANAGDGNPLCDGGPDGGGPRQYGLTCVAGDCAECQPAGNDPDTGLNARCGGTSCIAVDLTGDGSSEGVCGRCDYGGDEDDAVCPDGTQCQSDGRCRRCTGNDDCAGRGDAEVCNAGVCEPCVDDGQCDGHPDGNVCVLGRCTSCAEPDVGCVRNEGEENEQVHDAGQYCDEGTGYCTDCVGLPAACVAGSRTSVCDSPTGVCRSCRNDVECPDGANPICITDPDQNDPDVRICRVCDPPSDRGCVSDSTAPRCSDAGGAPACVGCTDNAHCADNPRGNLCDDVVGSLEQGACKRCESAVDCENHLAGNICRNDLCGRCERDADCIGHPQGNVCIGNFCSPCANDESCDGNPLGGKCAEVDGDGVLECEVCNPAAAAGQSGCPNNLVCAVVDNGDDPDTVQCVGCRGSEDCGPGRLCVEEACFGDFDGDGTIDADDNCPVEPNPDQLDSDLDDDGDACDDDDDNDGIPDETEIANGTDPLDPDSDGDGHDDNNDNCPLADNNDQADNDDDELGDACDNCPDDDNPDQANLDGDALGDACDPDVDGDGFANDVDNCVETDNVGQADTDEDQVGDACERACASNTNCDSGHVCEPGGAECVQCVGNEDCGPGEQCRAFVCNGDGGPCDVGNGDADCNNGEICEANTCVPAECDVDGACVADPAAEQCVNNRCEQCDQAANGNADCAAVADAPICDANACRGCNEDNDCAGFAGATRCDPSGSCEECVQDAHCQPGQICEANACVAAECASDEECDGNPAGGQCVTSRCEQCDVVDDAGCAIGENCVGAVCLDACLVGGDCGANEICEAGGCVAEQCDPNNGDLDCAGNAPATTCDDGRCVECTGDGECGAGEICEGGACEAQACDVENLDADCPAGQDCVAGRCEQCDVADVNAGCNAGDGEQPICVANACVQCAGNGDCAAPTPTCVEGTCVDLVDFCRLQFPVDLAGGSAASAGTTVTVYGRIYEEGLTDQTLGPDDDGNGNPVVEVGVGPDGSDPTGNPGWRWTAMAANALFDAQSEGEPNNDEYEGAMPIPLTGGPYDFAVRVSLDNGATHVYCDSGQGSGDGYAPADAGQLEIDTTEVCDDGVDNDSDGDADCADADCDGQIVCLNRPAAGEVIINEIMYDPSAVDDSVGEYIELLNVTGAAIDLDGLVLTDTADTQPLTIAGGTSIAAGGTLVFVRDADAQVNGGIAGGIAFGFALANGGDTITLTLPGAPDVTIDSVTYEDDANGWPDAAGASVQLDSTNPGAADRNDPANWCLSAVAYGDGDLGSPGGANVVCQ